MSVVCSSGSVNVL